MFIKIFFLIDLFLVAVLIGVTIGCFRMLGYVHKILGIPNDVTIKDYMKNHKLVEKE